MASTVEPPLDDEVAGVGDAAEELASGEAHPIHHVDDGQDDPCDQGGEQVEGDAVLRLPVRVEQAASELYAELRRWADEEFRSVNGQIEFLLQRAVDEKRKRRKGGGASAPADDNPDE